MFCLYKNKGSKTPKAVIFNFLVFKKNVLKIDIMILLQTYLMYLNFFCCSKSKVQDSVDSKLINTGTKNLMYRDQDIIS